MASRWSKSRLLICVLVLHVAHAPVPWCDGDDVVRCAVERYAGPGRSPAGDRDVQSAGEWDWDIDVVLLGVSPPWDTDQGPLDPERLFVEGLETPYIVPPFACEFRPRLEGRGGDRADVPFPRASLTVLAPCGRPPRCFGASFASPDSWRTLLTVLTC
jgi:hypothetical protein